MDDKEVKKKKKKKEGNGGKKVLAVFLVLMVILTGAIIADNMGLLPEGLDRSLDVAAEKIDDAWQKITHGKIAESIEKAVGGGDEEEITPAAVEEPKHEPITTPVEEPKKPEKEDALDVQVLTEAAVEGPGVASEKEKEATAYRDKYPTMVTSPPATRIVMSNTIFLTFDDGPSKNTEKVLDILDKYEVKATFFLVGNHMSSACQDTLERMVNAGHAIGVHTTCHNYNTIYASVGSYLDDFAVTYQFIYDYTGTYPTFFRFPGGSKNSFNKDTYAAIISEMNRRGFTYFDWNISGGDATTNATEQSVLSYATTGVNKKDLTNRNLILLLHDTSDVTVSQLPSIIKAYQDAGFSFAPLTNEIKPVVF